MAHVMGPVENVSGDMLHFPAAARNIDSICDVLARVVKVDCDSDPVALEVAAGSGQHVVRLARLFPQVTWCPSDIDDSYLKR